jgi:hypothetical protein
MKSRTSGVPSPLGFDPLKLKLRNLWRWVPAIGERSDAVLRTAMRGDERGESSPDYQPFVPAEAGTQGNKSIQ